MHPQRIRDQKKIRVLRVPLSILIPLHRPPLHTGQVRKLLLR